MSGNDLSLGTIRKLFEQQIKYISQKACRNELFDIQFSDRWI